MRSIRARELCRARPEGDFITGRGTKFIWRCTSRSRGSSAPGRSISFWHDITACITDTRTRISMLCSLWLIMFLERAFGPTKVILNISSNGDYESTETEYDPRQCVKQVANKHLRLTENPSTNLEKSLRRLD